MLSIAPTRITVHFDHVNRPNEVKKVKSKFMVMKNYYVYREQYPLILAYAVTIHKCQGFSLDCTIVDLTQEVFSDGMAYVAISRVRTLAGLHLVAFEPSSIMVSATSLKEVNRLREAYWPDLQPYALPARTRATRKRKLTGAAVDGKPLPKKDHPEPLPKRKRARDVPKKGPKKSGGGSEAGPSTGSGSTSEDPFETGEELFTSTDPYLRTNRREVCGSSPRTRKRRSRTASPIPTWSTSCVAEKSHRTGMSALPATETASSAPSPGTSPARKTTTWQTEKHCWLTSISGQM